MARIHSQMPLAEKRRLWQMLLLIIQVRLNKQRLNLEVS